VQPSVSSNYVLLSPLSAVRLRDDPDVEGGFCVLPAGLTIAVRGDSSISGLIDVVCDGRDYAIFQTDLEERGEPLTH
jgi:hypothetical protein